MKIVRLLNIPAAPARLACKPHAPLAVGIDMSSTASSAPSAPCHKAVAEIRVDVALRPQSRTTSFNGRWLGASASPT